ncbi:outer membrane protein assembly factor BamE [Sphingomonas sp. KRR8]|uniref:outer membrane protein assembly factor BamE n=1 Tax=Sphingomonas sp. KRR8 TaxID=2942996 RepID=UPI0020220100|nr:outer membrane protein assembly factor BamE [Sphingomonas sp. KRR8]URD60154.1 outer membrane protein assembly factor BamE [Sphingomonas sp. KRR8]
MIRTTSLAVAAAVLLAGCSSVGTRENKGFILDKELVSAIQVGVDNKDSVAKTLGRPSFTSEFNDNEWYYVQRQTSTVAFRLPRVREQTVLRIRFDQAGNVASIDKTGREQIASIKPYGKQTPTLGRRKSFFEDVFGGIGVVGAGGPGAGDDQGQ